PLPTATPTASKKTVAKCKSASSDTPEPNKRKSKKESTEPSTKKPRVKRSSAKKPESKEMHREKSNSSMQQFVIFSNVLVAMQILNQAQLSIVRRRFQELWVL